MEAIAMNVTYDQIVGHERPIRVLKAAIKNNRIAHAYLFSGPDGIGKRTSAIAFAAALNCEKDGAEACGQCRSCKKIADGNHPDFSMIERDGNFIKIEQIREIGRLSHFGPYEGRMRVFLFQDAEKMNVNAANALLKTLEEPRPNNMLVLLTSNPQQLLPTILSRCQRINFNPLTIDQIETIIRDRIESDPEQARILARLSGGSLGWVMQADIETVIDKRRALLTELADIDPLSETDLVSFAENLSEKGADMDAILETIKVFIRDAVVLAGAGDEQNLVNIDISDKVRSFASRYSPQRLLEMGRSIGYAQRLLIRNVNKNLIANSLALELAHPTGAGFISPRMPR